MSESKKIQENQRNYSKFFIGLLACFLFRLIPFRPPNIEPILATQMPFTRIYGPVAGFLFGFLSIFLFDLVTSGIGVWTWITSLAYGVVALGATYFFSNREGTALNYGLFAILATLFFDAVTGLTIGPIFEHQPFMVALTGQIPFTLLHLLGNVSFSILLSPSIYQWAGRTSKPKRKRFILSEQKLSIKYS